MTPGGTSDLVSPGQVGDGGFAAMGLFQVLGGKTVSILHRKTVSVLVPRPLLVFMRSERLPV